MLSYRRRAPAYDGTSGLAVYAHFILPLLLALTACSDVSPICPVLGEGDNAPSAGCFSTSDGGLLLIQGFNDKVSLPGGRSLPEESAQCTAFRETWEETGLRLEPKELLAVFDTGFHLYRCDRNAGSGEIDPPPRFEVRAAFYLQPDRFEEYGWRFPDQRVILMDMLSRDIHGKHEKPCTAKSCLE